MTYIKKKRLEKLYNMYELIKNSLIILRHAGFIVLSKGSKLSLGFKKTEGLISFSFKILTCYYT